MAFERGKVKKFNARTDLNVNAVTFELTFTQILLLPFTEKMSFLVSKLKN